MEKLALGPQDLLAENKRLIYARLTGFGQEGIYSKRAGHDINYVALSGLLSMLGWESDKRPSPPLNLIADFAGGSVLCALGIMMALAERTRSGQGQVVDCSMVAGSAYLASWIFRGQGSQLWSNPRAKNFLDGGAFFYDTYETKDGKWMAVGALEPQFYSQLINGLGLDEEQVPQICSAEDGERFRKLFAQIFKSKTRAEWCEVFDGRDACVTPILSLEEAALNQHNIDNKTFSKNADGAFSPNPAPILSRTPAKTNFHKCNPGCGDDTEQILLNDLGYSKTDVERFEDLGAIMRNKL
ncbi:hypothetical protein LSTR_LSTR001208 [Laodelphax striatellus]|uniref:Alpha-methylacyl-CoA racemase n=1 Tax=Laodelphax striatellus TaxID=195883 RepID=A0A482XBZ6_LAOST|nr:hypothetical protein LSTR_LSTR001208 [Laodelphax striatellus]